MTTHTTPAQPHLDRLAILCQQHRARRLSHLEGQMELLQEKVLDLQARPFSFAISEKLIGLQHRIGALEIEWRKLSGKEQR